MKPAPPVTIARTSRILRTAVGLAADVRHLRGPRRLGEDRRRPSSSARGSRRTGEEVVATREPGGTELGERIRDLVLHGGHVAPWAEALLYAAARAQHVDEVIRPALERGASVICDRYVDSSVAYQGVARGLGLERVLDLNLAAVGGLMPDRTFLLALDAAELPEPAAPASTTGSSASPTTSTRASARAIASWPTRFPERIVVLDATRPADELAEEVYGALRVRT